MVHIPIIMLKAIHQSFPVVGRVQLFIFSLPWYGGGSGRTPVQGTSTHALNNVRVMVVTATNAINTSCTFLRL